jgi:hypothetical protein
MVFAAPDLHVRYLKVIFTGQYWLCMWLGILLLVGVEMIVLQSFTAP